MGAFIIGGLVFSGTILICLIMMFAAGMSDSPSAADGVGRRAFGTLIGGSLLSAAIVGSHWMPHIGW